VQVKLLPQQGELYVLVQSRDRVAKKLAIRRRQILLPSGRQLARLVEQLSQL
jgi:hypothetical protein